MGQEYMTGKDIFINPDGSVYHVGVKKGECYQRIITVGSHSRADSIAKFFDKDSITTNLVSARLFKVISGKYQGVGITVIAIGMGACLIDFMVRELSFLDERPFAIIRLGTCGILAKGVEPGTIMVADQCSYLQTNYGYFDGSANDEVNDFPKSGAKPYMLTRPIPADSTLYKSLAAEVAATKFKHVCGINVAAETFYACQGRNLALFKDENEHVIEDCLKIGAVSLEMESHQLFHLAKKRTVPMATAALHVGIVNRTSPELDKNITPEQLESATLGGAEAAFKALAAYKFA